MSLYKSYIWYEGYEGYDKKLESRFSNAAFNKKKLVEEKSGIVRWVGVMKSPSSWSFCYLDGRGAKMEL